jgi:hypothetical protein
MTQDVMLWLLLGIGAGATFGRWRAERIRARRDMNTIWINKSNSREYKRWKIFRH